MSETTDETKPFDFGDEGRVPKGEADPAPAPDLADLLIEIAGLRENNDDLDRRVRMLEDSLVELRAQLEKAETRSVDVDVHLHLPELPASLMRLKPEANAEPAPVSEPKAAQAVKAKAKPKAKAKKIRRWG